MMSPKMSPRNRLALIIGSSVAVLGGVLMLITR